MRTAEQYLYAIAEQGISGGVPVCRSGINGGKSLLESTPKMWSVPVFSRFLQVNFMDKTPRTNLELYEVNINSLRSLK